MPSLSPSCLVRCQTGDLLLPIDANPLGIINPTLERLAGFGDEQARFSHLPATWLSYPSSSHTPGSMTPSSPFGLSQFVPCLRGKLSMEGLVGLSRGRKTTVVALLLLRYHWIIVSAVLLESFEAT